jgi:transforming growth factor-beta-induced protein
VFAPTNAAFEALPAGVLANLLKPENKAQLVDILTYHVVSGNVSASDLTNAELVKTVEGKSVSVNIEGHSVFLNVGTNGAKVITANVEASNGVVHLIDAVLLPPAAAFNGNLVQLAEAVPELSTLVKAVVAAGLVSTLEGKGPFTVFAPTNDAFDRLPAGLLNYLLNPAHKAELIAVLTYHVVSGEVYR